MKFDLQHYLKEIDTALVAAGAEVEVYADVCDYQLKGYSLVREGAPAIYISAGMHGDEPAGPLALLELVNSGLLDRNLSFYICPALNPTGLANGTRENCSESSVLDMNRDYSSMRSMEVQGHVQWLEKIQPELFISLHEDWESGGYYFYEINTKDDDPNRYEYIVSQLKEVMLMENESVIDDHEVRLEGWIYHEAEADLPDEWPEAIYMAKNGCPLSFTLESPSGLAMRHRVEAHVVAVKSILEYEYGAAPVNGD